ncbi:MAG: magnesium transporter, partial [Lachnospiraceae bacterium]|nr:magnesium transporter [Candidatus Minthocola equi]
LALPVVDSGNRMVGIVTVDDVVDVIQEEVTEDIEMMNAMRPSEKTYLHSSPIDLFRQRFPWLMLLMVSATFTGMIITGFENALSAQLVLTMFIPMLMGTGGNSGSQSAVTVIRAMSVGDIGLSDVIKVIWKEISNALLCGVGLGIVCFL